MARFVKLHKDSRIPQRGTSGSAGYDLHSIGNVHIPTGCRVLVPTGIGWENVEDGLVGLIKPRSGLSYNCGTMIMAGVIDSDYPSHKDIGVLVYNSGDHHIQFLKGDKIAQLVITQFFLMEDDEATAIRDAGFGSTGR